MLPHTIRGWLSLMWAMLTAPDEFKTEVDRAIARTKEILK